MICQHKHRHRHKQHTGISTSTALFFFFSFFFFSFFFSVLNGLCLVRSGQVRSGLVWCCMLPVTFQQLRWWFWCGAVRCGAVQHTFPSLPFPFLLAKRKKNTETKRNKTP